MPIYHQLGEVPRKRHQVFRKTDGSLYYEELAGNMGFTGPASLLYHLHRPTEVRGLKHLHDVTPQPASSQPLRHRHFRTCALSTGPDAILDRVPILFNQDVVLSLVRPMSNRSFYRNAQADEVIYVSEGGGILESPLGRLAFQSGSYLVIPRGILHRYVFSAQPQSLLVIESTGYVRTPKRYRNEFGQLTESSPYNERDIRRPSDLKTYDESGSFPVIVKKASQLHELTYAHHPLDVVGWDGYFYPWTISIHDFEPRTGRFHLPPPIHQTFEGDGFVICSFCPRPYDFDPTAVPAPYSHSNVMSDEVLYYANSEFMSRSGVEYGSITLHPDGLAHGPQPGRTEASLGKKDTNELAVMLDTFRPLQVAQSAVAIEDPDYYLSWLE